MLAPSVAAPDHNIDDVSVSLTIGVLSEDMHSRMSMGTECKDSVHRSKGGLSARLRESAKGLEKSKFANLKGSLIRNSIDSDIKFSACSGDFVGKY